jgi:hypothetical protein
MKKLAAAVAGTAVLALGGAPIANAGPPPVTGIGSQGKGAVVLHCSQFGLFSPSEGVFVGTPSGNVGGSNQSLLNCVLGPPF